MHLYCCLCCNFMALFCAHNCHNIVGLICCSFPALCFPPSSHGLYGSGSQSANPVGGKSKTLQFTRFLVYTFSALVFSPVKCAQKGLVLNTSLCFWLQHSGVQTMIISVSAIEIVLVLSQCRCNT